MGFAPRHRLGPYEILAPIGAGGMGEVYKARDTRLDRTAALKILPAHLAAREDLRQRFEVEARAIARLQHANICAVFDVGQENGVDYLILEYLEGETLEKRLERGSMAISEAIQLGAQIAAGLDAAHRAGITHRDLKPGNVMLTKAGAKLLDFGLAKLQAPQAKPAAGGSGDEVATLTKALTTEGTIMGTFQYMAPEQLEGAEADARTDIFALGLILFEAATGRKAFQGKSQATLISATMSSDPPPASSVQPLTPPALDRVILRCLAKDPDERWQTARDLGRELEWIAVGGSQVGVAARAAKQRRLHPAWLLAAVAVMATAVVSWLHFRERAELLPLARFTVALPKQQLLAGPLLSPDGSKALVWLGTAARSWQMCIYTLATAEYHPLAGTERSNLACWSPDGRYVAALNDGAGELRKVEASTGGFAVLAKTKGTAPVAWSTNGVVLFGDGTGSLYRVPARGGTPQRVLSVAASETIAGLAEFLPDGEHFLFGVLNGSGVETRLGSLSGGQPKAILQSNSPTIFSRTGHLLFVRSDALLAQAFDAGTFALSGAPVTVAPSVNTASGRVFSVSSNGVLTYYTGGANAGQRLAWFDRSGRRISEVGGPDQYTSPALSPDGKRLAVGVGDINRRNRDIWVFDLVRGGSYRLTFDPADDLNPTWSPDGRYIAFASDRKGKRDLYRKLASGTGEEEVLVENQTEHKVPESASHDGRYIFGNVSIPGKTGAAIYLLSLADRKFERYITGPFVTDMAQLSPDGRWLAYHAAEPRRDEVYLQPFPATGERWQVSTAGGTEPQWRGDSKELFFINGNTVSAVDIKPAGKSIEIGILHALFEAKISATSTRNRFVAAADGQRFLVVVEGDRSETVSFETVMNWPELLRGK